MVGWFGNREVVGRLEKLFDEWVAGVDEFIYSWDNGWGLRREEGVVRWCFVLYKAKLSKAHWSFICKASLL